MPFHCVLEDLGDGADEEALGDGVHRAEELGDCGLKYRRDDADEADDDADQGERRERDLLCRRRFGRRSRWSHPADGGAGEQQHEQHGGGRDRAADGHHPGAPRGHRAVGDRAGVVGAPGGPQTAPPGLGRGAAQPSRLRASSKFLSLRIGLGTSAPFAPARTRAPCAKIYPQPGRLWIPRWRFSRRLHLADGRGATRGPSRRR